MVLDKQSGKYLDSEWHKKRQEIIRDIDERDMLTDWEKAYYEVTNSQIGQFDPDNYNLSEAQKRARGMV